MASLAKLQPRRGDRFLENMHCPLLASDREGYNEPRYHRYYSSNDTV